MQKEIPQHLVLSDGNKMPLKGLGTYMLNDGNEDIIEKAIEIGYRTFDTASSYKNEKFLGKCFQKAISSGLVKREELFVVSKLWNNQKTDVEGAIKQSLSDLQFDYVDLYLIHYPGGFYNEKGEYVNIPLYKTWREMEALVKKGLVKSIGVSNFNTQLLLDLLSYAEIKPSINQIEVHPYLPQEKLINFCQQFGINIMGYGPFTRLRGNVLEDEVIVKIAETHKKTTSEIILNWLLVRSIVSIPKSSDTKRLKDNFNVDNFAISQEEVQLINKLDKNLRCFTRVLTEEFKVPLFD